MRSTALSAIALVLLGCASVAVLAADTPATPPAFSFYDYLLGEWEVVRGTARVDSSEQTIDSVIRGHYFFEKENGTMNLVGRYFDNDTSTGEITNLYSVVVEFASPTAGAFKVGAPAPSAADDDDADADKASGPTTLFEFDFEQQMTTGMALSFGAWKADVNKPQRYQFAASAWDRFLITLFPAGAGAKSGDAKATDEMTVFIGRKIPVVTAKSFWGNWGSMLMLGGFFIFNMFVQKKAKGYQAQQASQARRRGAQMAGGKGGAQVEMADDAGADTDAPAASNATKKKA